MKTQQVILASASPRRLALLRQLGYAVRVCPADFEELNAGDGSAEEIVLLNALGKCRAACAVTGTALPVIAADTVVAVGESILGKPSGPEEARLMLRRLSGREHRVLTGIAVRYGRREEAEICVTRVFFRSLTDEEIDGYIATGEPLDKAGGYGFAGGGAGGVDRIDGCYNNVVGLPLTRLHLLLSELGVGGDTIQSDKGDACG